MTADIELLPCSVEQELRVDAAIIRRWIDVANGPINREALADRLDRYANAAAELTAEIERLRAEVERVTCELMDAITRADKLAEALRRYRNEVPLGHQPHMLAHEVDDLLREQEEGK